MTRSRMLFVAGTALVLVAGAVYINLPAEADPADDIAGAPTGQIANLVVLDDDFDRWYVARVSRAHVDGTRLTFTYVTGRCEKDGLVGYALDPQLSATYLTVIAGETGRDCDSPAIPHRADVTLDEPLASQRLVLVHADTG